MTKRIVSAAIAAVAAVAVFVGLQGQVPRDAGTWVPAAPMSGVREGAASVLLADGRVNLTIGQRAVTVTADAQSKGYDEVDRR